MRPPGTRSLFLALSLFTLFHWVTSAEDVSYETCSFAGQPGFRCPRAGDCIPLYWVCDGETQCEHPDDADEVLGCNLFPETGCKSWGGQPHHKCPATTANGGRTRCVADLTDCDTPFDGGGTSCNKETEFQCLNGLCIIKSLTCDGVSHCEDGSDETDGCNLFPDEAPCLSWFGERYVQCRSDNVSGSVCTVPELADTDCRSCGEIDQWRCDDGRCIHNDKVQDGIKDCGDGSDEEIYHVKWWLALILTLSLAFSGVFLSFTCRIWNNKKLIFDCVLCSSSRAREIRKVRGGSEFDTIDSMQPTISISMGGDNYSRQESVCGGGTVEEYAVLFDLVDIFEHGDNWRKMSLMHKKEPKGQHLYAQIHQNTVLYKALYRYLCYRISSPADLSRALEQLLRWEKDFHGENHVDAVACWRLHLGSSETLEKMVACTREPGVFKRFYQRYLPTKDKWHKMRKDLPLAAQQVVERLYSVWNTMFYLFVPLLGASLFYFDIIKDCCLAAIFYLAHSDLTQKDFGSYPFESTVTFSLMASIVVAQLLFAVVSVYFSGYIFEWCDHKTATWKRNIFRLICLLLAPLMPAFVLANHVHYLCVEYTTSRVLQTMTQDSDRAERLKVFKELLHARYRAQLYRRLYSFYRVINATTQSFTVIVCVVVTTIVTSRGSKDVHLIEGVAEKIKDFFNLEQGSAFIENFQVVRDFVIGGCVLYSALMILSALLRYVKQCKNMTIVMGGRICLGAYFCCHLIARLTIFVALFSTAEAESDVDPAVPLLGASIIGFVLWVMHAAAIFTYKMHKVPNFAKSDLMEKVVHVLANTLVVIPFMQWDVEDATKEKPSDVMPFIENAGEKVNGVTLRVPGNGRRRARSRTASIQASPVPPEKKRRIPVFRFPSIHEPLVSEVGDLNERITNLWWETPNKKLNREETIVKMASNGMLSCMRNDSIAKAYDDLDKLKFINKMRLYHPQKTKTEYFWLFILHLFFNAIALIVEWTNGGTATSQGLYYSWDVRLGSYFLGLIFLALYYKRYHPMRDLTSPGCCKSLIEILPIVCCCRTDPPLAAPPDEETLRFFMAGDRLEGVDETEEDGAAALPVKATKEMETQTSIRDEEDGTAVKIVDEKEDVSEEIEMKILVKER